MQGFVGQKNVTVTKAFIILGTDKAQVCQMEVILKHLFKYCCLGSYGHAQNVCKPLSWNLSACTKPHALRVRKLDSLIIINCLLYVLYVSLNHKLVCVGGGGVLWSYLTIS